MVDANFAQLKFESREGAVLGNHCGLRGRLGAALLQNKRDRSGVQFLVMDVSPAIRKFRSRLVMSVLPTIRHFRPRARACPSCAQSPDVCAPDPSTTSIESSTSAK